MFEIDFPSLGGNNQVKNTGTSMNFLSTVTKSSETDKNVCSTETTEKEKTILHNGIVLSVL